MYSYNMYGMLISNTVIYRESCHKPIMIKCPRDPLFKAVPGNLVDRGQNTPNFEFILIRLYRSSWCQPFSPKPRGYGITARSLKYGYS